MFTQLMAHFENVHFHIFRAILVCGCTASATASATGLPVDLLPSANLAAATLNGSIDTNRHWTTESLIARQRYAVEMHRVTTQDGYTLMLHRLPRPGHQPVLLVHGLYGSANDFVIMGRNVSLAFALWDRHYDVWLANCRGSFNAQQHAHFKRDDPPFWNFSVHELGAYDLPALIDYVRGNTSFHAVHFVGYSQGATALLVMAALRPAYVEKLALVQLLAPLAYFRHTKVEPSVLRSVKQFLQNATSRELREFLPRGFMHQLGCFASKVEQLSCLQLIFRIVGPDLTQFDQSKFTLIFSQLPAGGSVKQLRHLHQLYTAGQFRHYDYGLEGNYDKYAAAVPPPYNLSQQHVPTVLHFAANDHLASAEDVLLLGRQLPALRRLHLVRHAQFNHLDFIWAKDLAMLVNDVILQELEDLARPKTVVL